MSREGTDASQPPDSDLADLLGSLTPADLELHAPPADLWQHIASATADAPNSSGGASVHSINDRSARGAGSGRDKVSLGSSRPTGALLAAAAAILLLAGIAGVVVNRDDSPQPIAQANLAFDPAAFDPLGSDAEATVSLVEDDGAMRLSIDESLLPTEPDADLEVWLIQPDADGNPADLVSLGTIDPDSPDELPVPESHDPDVFYVVDISIEPHDGDAAHSGRSILRGPLTQA